MDTLFDVTDQLASESAAERSCDDELPVREFNRDSLLHDWPPLDFELRTVDTDPKARAVELFTLEGSNRAQVFARPSFKARVEKLGLEGITFQPVGEVV